MTDVPARLSLREAATALGVHYQTAYRWVRQGVLPAAKVGGSYEVGADAVDALRRERAVPAEPPARRQVRDWNPFAGRVEAGLVAGDEAAVRDLVEDLVVGGVSLAEICDRVLVPALVKLGQAWFAGDISVAEEHRASAICERVLGRWSAAPPGRPRGTAVVCAAPTDEHKLPGEMATAVLRQHHWRVHHLGTGVPTAQIRYLAAAEDADVVVISVAWPPARILAEGLAADLRADGRRALVGRPGMTLSGLLVAVDDGGGR